MPSSKGGGRASPIRPRPNERGSHSRQLYLAAESRARERDPLPLIVNSPRCLQSPRAAAADGDGASSSSVDNEAFIASGTAQGLAAPHRCSFGGGASPRSQLRSAADTDGTGAPLLDAEGFLASGTAQALCAPHRCSPRSSLAYGSHCAGAGPSNCVGGSGGASSGNGNASGAGSASGGGSSGGLSSAETGSVSSLSRSSTQPSASPAPAPLPTVQAGPVRELVPWPVPLRPLPMPTEAELCIPVPKEVHDEQVAALKDSRRAALEAGVAVPLDASRCGPSSACYSLHRRDHS